MHTPALTRRILVCVAWPYANAATNIGQIAGSFLPGDIFARYQRMAGREVLLVSGSDMHGTPITVAAEHAGLPPRELAHRAHSAILDDLRHLGIAYDIYTHTDTERHIQQAQAFFQRLLGRGLLFAARMEAPYCARDRRFLPDRYVEGTCPYCEQAGARGDQCLQCGRTLDPAQLLEPACRLCGTHAIEIRETEHYFLDLPQLEGQLRDWIATAGRAWRPNALNFALNWLKEGLRPRAITRDIEWGVPVPAAGYDDKRIYVWFEAVVGYLSATMEWAALSGRSEAWRDFWQPDSAGDAPARAYYFAGKDNIAFHTIFWPAMLLGHGDLALPYDVAASEFLLAGTQRTSLASASSAAPGMMSTRDALALAGPDALRYYLAATLPESGDSVFSIEELVRRNNDELLAAYGNLAHRVLTFTQRHFGGSVPPLSAPRPADEALLAQVRECFVSVGAAIEAVRLREALGAAMALARASNRYLDEQAPWKHVTLDRDGAAATVYTAIQALSGLSVLLSPFIPHASQRLRELLGGTGDVARQPWQLEVIPPGRALPAPTPLVARLEVPISAPVTEPS